MSRYAHIVGWGKYVPEQVVTNDDLAAIVDTSDGWIRERTGIAERRIVSPKESTATISIQAARAALEVADVDPTQLDLIIVATVTPEYAFPATACLVQDALGAPKAAAFDLSAGCSGFIYALSIASQGIIAGAYDLALVIGAETLSRIVDWEDRNTCVLFGDGAGAVVLQASDSPGGVLASVLGADGSGGDLLILPAGGSRHPASAETVANREHYIHMDGRKVFRFATRVMARAAREAAEQAGISVEDVALFIPHQANKRIIQAAAKALRLPLERFYMNLERYGNTSTASIPIALCEAIEAGRLKRDDYLLLVGFGAGLTWGATVVQWGVPLPAPAPSWRWRLWRQIRYRLAVVGSFLRRLVRWVEGLFVSLRNGG